MISVNSVTVSPQNPRVEVGQWYYLMRATVKPDDATNSSVYWTSSDTEVAAINKLTGIVYAKSIGQTIIRATAKDGSFCFDEVTLIVSETVPVTDVELNYSNISLNVGDSKKLTATVAPVNATNDSLSWYSSNYSVVNVSNNGTITALSEGTAKICAVSNDAPMIKDCCDVTVTKATLVSSVNVSMPKISISKGDSVQLYAEVLPENATNNKITWSSNDTNIATVNSSSGIVYGKNKGTTTICAKATDGSGKYDSCEVTVTYYPVESVKLSQKFTSVRLNKTVKIDAKVLPENATNKSLTWTSSDSSIATVDIYGNITGHKLGSATITATAMDGNIESTCKVFVVIDTVVVEKDDTGEYEHIRFGNSGKIWNIINHDVINDYTLNNNDPFSQRFYENLFHTKIVDDETGLVYYQEPYKEYTDDEIELLYTLDPYGVAAYVESYAEKLAINGDSIQDSLRIPIEYKDHIFELLFGYKPKYYKRDNGVWKVTTDKSDYTEILSESEFLFGRHVIYDIDTLEAFINVVIDLFSMAINCPQLKEVTKPTQKMTKYFSLYRSVVASVLKEDFKEFISGIVDFISDDIVDYITITLDNSGTANFVVGWAVALISLSDDLDALAETFRSGPHFYKEVFTQCEKNLPYAIYIRTTNNNLILLPEINSVIE